MKKVFKSFISIIVCFAAVLLISCDDDNTGNSEMEVLNVEIPEWSVNPLYGAENIPALIFNGSASNFNETIKAEIKKTPVNIDVKNVIFMFFDGLTDELIASTKEKSNGELLLNELPVKMTFTAQNLNENVDEAKVVGKLLSFSPYYKICSYVTNTSVANDFFRQFRASLTSEESEDDRVHQVVCGNPRPSFLLAKDTKSGRAKNESADLNDFWKSTVKFVTDFKDAVDCYGNPEIVIPGEEGHPTYTTDNLKGLFCVYPYNAAVYPSPIQSMAFTLAYTETKAKAEGFFVVFYNNVQGTDKEKELKTFDEAVIAASKYVLENPDTILVVTSAALDGSSIPVYALGNIPEAAKSSTSLLDFVKAAVPESE